MEFPTGITVLSGHTSPETAYIIADYPYGRILRCKKRVWIETNKNGQRVVSQTTDPKRPVEFWNKPWNKPKASTYSMVRVLYIDGNGHVQNWAVSPYSDDAEIAQFRSTFCLGLTDRDRAVLDAFVEARTAYRLRRAAAQLVQDPSQV